jgi:ADP-ribose pyrophosphatase YjhB (NUDIX family)
MGEGPEGWLSAEDWAKVQHQVPIVCVDVLPLQLAKDEAGVVSIAKVGFIERSTPHQGRRLMLVGGRVNYGETLTAALGRHIHDALGEQAKFVVSMMPVYVAQYFPTRQEGQLFDPRQHTVALTYCFAIAGELQAGGEASEFAWYDKNDWPSEDHFGFNQDQVARECLARVKNQIWTL